jgi:hypothetical protein
MGIAGSEAETKPKAIDSLFPPHYADAFDAIGEVWGQAMGDGIVGVFCEGRTGGPQWGY